jgi:translocator protein
MEGWKLWVGLAGWIVAAFAAAAVGALFTPGEWYAHLNKPAWNPPSWVFGPVWTALYLGMAVAAWLVWKRGGFAGAPLALGLFLAQLLFNGAWSWLFFGLHRPGLALAEILVLWALILATLVAFWAVHRAAGLLFVPYLAWVSFASFLNFTLWRLNR